MYFKSIAVLLTIIGFFRTAVKILHLVLGLEGLKYEIISLGHLIRYQICISELFYELFERVLHELK